MRRDSPRSGLAGRPSGLPLSGWECAGEEPSTGSLLPIRCMGEKKKARWTAAAGGGQGRLGCGLLGRVLVEQGRAQPNLHSFSEAGEPLRLVEQSLEKDDPDPRRPSVATGFMCQSWRRRGLRFVDGRPVSAITKRFLEWCSEHLAAIGKKVWVLIWDNASWHISREVRRWIGRHNREVKVSGSGVRKSSPVLVAQKESVAQRDRAQGGSWQTQGGRTRRIARRPRVGR